MIDLVNLKAAINLAIQMDEGEKFDATFKLALLLNDEELQPKTKRIAELVNKRSTKFVDAYKALYDEFKCFKLKDGEEKEAIKEYKVLFGMVSLAVPNFDGDEEKEKRYNEAYEDLEKEYDHVIKELNKAIDERININLEVVSSDKVPWMIGYRIMKNLKLMLRV